MALETKADLPFGEALTNVREVLAAESFGVLSERGLAGAPSDREVDEP